MFLAFKFKKPVFWIRDISVRTYPDPALFVSDIQDDKKKKVFACYFSKVHFYNSSKDKKSQKEEIKVFLTIFA
jgi:hypothetical protein